MAASQYRQNTASFQPLSQRKERSTLQATLIIASLQLEASRVSFDSFLRCINDSSVMRRHPLSVTPLNDDYLYVTPSEM
jgi:hypothetical protein